MARKLWHYACSHSVQAIIDDNGRLRPNPNAGVQEVTSRLAGFEVRTLPVVWLTDLSVGQYSDAAKIGLLSPYVDCNRVEYRFRVTAPQAVWWPNWADENIGDQQWRRLLEFNCQPERWWVSETPILGARLDDGYRGPAKP